MIYPTLKEVEAADRKQLAIWYRGLQSPGWAYLNKSNFNEKLTEETEIMDLIVMRFKEAGMFTPELSKQIGWEGRV